MSGVERFATKDRCDRDLFLLDLLKIYDFPEAISLSSPQFSCLIACDARNLDSEAIGRLAESMLTQGVVYVCAWGPDCERVHDIFDEEIVGAGPDVPRFNHGIMTTWRSDETLDQALWYFLSNTADDDFAETCRSAMVLVIGNQDWVSQARSALSDPSIFCEQVLSAEVSGRGHS